MFFLHFQAELPTYSLKFDADAELIHEWRSKITRFEHKKEKIFP